MDARKILTLLLVLGLPVIAFLLYERGDVPLKGIFTVEQEEYVVRLGNAPVRVTVADSVEERAQGLSGRRELPSTSGLLFIFEQSGFHGFWMKEMRFPIDIIWIDENFRIVDIEANVSPSTFPQTFEPGRPARFVVETNANYTESFGIEVGDVVTLPRALIPEDLQQ